VIDVVVVVLWVDEYCVELEGVVEYGCVVGVCYGGVDLGVLLGVGLCCYVVGVVY